MGNFFSELRRRNAIRVGLALRPLRSSWRWRSSPGTSWYRTIEEPDTVYLDKSAAVLPFADLSENQDQEWFADGLTEEILNSLARLPESKVTARTSSFEFKNTNTDISHLLSAD